MVGRVPPRMEPSGRSRKVREAQRRCRQSIPKNGNGELAVNGPGRPKRGRRYLCCCPSFIARPNFHTTYATAAKATTMMISGTPISGSCIPRTYAITHGGFPRTWADTWSSSTKRKRCHRALTPPLVEKREGWAGNGPNPVPRQEARAEPVTSSLVALAVGRRAVTRWRGFAGVTTRTDSSARGRHQGP